ncbi:MAG TPA: hypothetical protein VIF57_11075 [Polyangia bacterium]|jgi:hypothetical protein
MIAMLLAMLAGANGATAGAPAAPVPSGRVRLTVERETGAESCPDERALRDALIGRLGFDPFDDAAAREIRCSVRRDHGAFRARIQVVSGTVSGSGGRELISRRDDCGELAEAIELAVGVAINPLVTAPPASPAPLTPASEPPPVPPSPPPSAPAALAAPAVAQAIAPAPVPARAARRYEIGLRADGAAALGFGPGTAAAMGLGASLRRRALSLDAEARIVAPSSAALASGSVSAWSWNATLGPCLHRGPVAACALGSGGVLRASTAGLAMTGAATAPYLAVGARGVLELPIGARWRLRWAAEIAAPLVTVHLAVDGRDVWTSPRVNALSSLGLAFIFD